MPRSSPGLLTMLVMMRLRHARKAARRTQEEVAEHLGVSTGAYCRMENGQVSVLVETVNRIAEFLGVETSSLFGREEP